MLEVLGLELHRHGDESVLKLEPHGRIGSNPSPSSDNTIAFRPFHPFVGIH